MISSWLGPTNESEPWSRVLIGAAPAVHWLWAPLAHRIIIFQNIFQVFAAKLMFIIFSLNSNQREDLIWRAVYVYPLIKIRTNGKNLIGVDNVSMFMLSRSILLMGVRARNMMGNANACEKWVQGLILPSQMGLNSSDFTIKLPLYHILEIMKTAKHFGLMTQQINPSKFAVIINKAHIITMPANRSWSQSPYIWKHKFQRIWWNNTNRLGIGQLMAFALRTCITYHIITRISNQRKFVATKDLLDCGGGSMT